MLRAICLLACSSIAVAQLNSSDLRAKLGPPLQREVFHLPQGFDLIADYSPGSQVCRLQVPALMPAEESVQREPVMKQRMYAFLADLVPPSMRGAELRKFTMINGLPSITTIEYENVSVVESNTGQHFSSGNTITITFKNASCENKAGAAN
jgi:hypothetical protein